MICVGQGVGWRDMGSVSVFMVIGSRVRRPSSTIEPCTSSKAPSFREFPYYTCKGEEVSFELIRRTPNCELCGQQQRSAWRPPVVNIFEL